ncbi:hypothetical protein [Photobacterium damselae]|uniref:hypothetical protein n=1 Tax=Photobacterium damselae TaxID=38293 RepID=UPI001F407848|nr:hypothetical protein [Photobacterium damselae]UKA04968.1 hypothetical protein IHC89_22240 [Photobacterium damselae subsp. damselae]
MSIVDRHKQIVADLDYIENTYGYMAGKDDYVRIEIDRFLREPNRNVAFEIIYYQLVEIYKKGYVFRVQTLGVDVIKHLPLTDSKVEEIQERWDLPTPIDTGNGK